MDYELLKEAFIEQQEKLDLYFEHELALDERAENYVEIHKRDLVNNLFNELFLIHSRETYQTYEPVKLIWIKAKRVWIDFVRRLDRETKRRVDKDPDELFANRCSNVQEEYESNQILEMIDKLLNPEERRLLRYRIDRFSFREIMLLENYPSEDAAKAKYYRVRCFIKQHFDRSDFLNY
jgi:hypothetical protein